jgi:glucose/arabinose dehydrogenase
MLVAWSLLLALAPILSVSTGLFGSASPPEAAAGPLAAPDNTLALQPFLTNGLTDPLLITKAGDGSNRLFIVERAGKIKVVVNGTIQGTPFLDLTSKIVSGSEQGLLGLAFHPQFKTNGRFFVFYTAKVPSPNPTPTVGDNTLEEYHATPGSNVADGAAVKELIRRTDRFENHNGGDLGFGQDGYLYVGTGDEGSGGDPDNNAQDITAANARSYFGKMLRLDVDHGAPYTIPPTNPFFGQVDKRQEVWAYGFRNPWRWSFDRLTGDMLVGDVGQSRIEEIDVLPKGQGGLNYGWRIREGAHCYNTANPSSPLPSCQTAGLIDPILEYDHSLGCAVIGGFIYRGTMFPTLQGNYVYADECSGRVWRARPQGNGWATSEALDTTLNPSAFGEDEAGEMYLVDLSGGVYQVTANEQPTATITPTATVTPTPPPRCAVRPRVVIQATSAGPGTLDVLVGASDAPGLTNNTLASIVFGRADNALVTAGSQANRPGGFSIDLPGGTRQTHFTVRRVQPNRPMQVDLTVTDQCGTWPTFVGAGINVP